jgi:hypothetical protein
MAGGKERLSQPLAGQTSSGRPGLTRPGSLKKTCVQKTGCGIGVNVYKWVRQAADALPEPEVWEEIREMELDELWHFLQAKKQVLDLENLLPESPIQLISGALVLCWVRNGGKRWVIRGWFLSFAS